MDTVVELIRAGFEVEQNQGWVCVRSHEPFFFVVKAPDMTPQQRYAGLREAVAGPRGYQVLALHDNGVLQIDVATRSVRNDFAARFMAGQLAQRIGAMVGLEAADGSVPA
jgi:hypothetical protein